MPNEPELKDTPTMPVEDVRHWNFGPASGKSEVPTDDTRSDPNWYQRDTEQRPQKYRLLKRLREMFR